jgi:streptogramin lyase
MSPTGKSRAVFLASALIAATASAQTITEFPVPEGGWPRSITAGPDGNLWFIEYFNDRAPAIGRITTAGEAVLIPIEGPPMGFAWDIAAGPDGNLWFTEADDGRGALVRVTPSGAVTRWPASTSPFAIPFGIAAGPDGNLWLSLAMGNADRGGIGRATTAGEVTLFPVQSLRGPHFESMPADLTAGPDGNVWFTEFQQDAIGRITPNGQLTEFPLPGAPIGIVAGSDGNLWFTQTSARIGRMTPQGALREFPVPTRGAAIAAGPDGALWYTQPEARIGRITTSGVVTGIEISAPALDITAGPDGNVWYTSRGKIGRINLAPAQVTDVRFLPVVGSTPGVGGSFFRTSIQLHNPTNGTLGGQIVIHRSGGASSGSSGRGRMSYALRPGETLSIPDLLPALGLSGTGSADLETYIGSPPIATVRVFNDAGAAGTMGFTEEPMGEWDALSPGQSGVLLLPADLTSFRFNIGVRTLLDGAAMTLTLRDSAGAVVGNVSRVFPDTYHEQTSAAEFLGISTLPAGGSISITIESGTAFLYGATVDNVTGDPSLQIARAPR